jgi:hypothetical protein
VIGHNPVIGQSLVAMMIVMMMVCLFLLPSSDCMNVSIANKSTENSPRVQ